MTNDEIKEKMALVNEGQSLSLADQGRILHDLLRANKKLILIRRQGVVIPENLGNPKKPSDEAGS